MGGAETMNSQPTFNQPRVRMASKMASYEIEEIELDRSHVVSFRQEQEAQISVSDILIYLTTLIEQSDIKSVSKIQNNSDIIHEIVLKLYEIKSMFEARINDTIQINNTILRKFDNSVFKQLRRKDFVTVVVYEAPYELKDSDLKSVLSKYGRIKGDVIRHHHKGYDIENGNRSVLYYEKPSNIPTTLWVQGNKVKMIYDGQDRTAICSYCKAKGHYRGICLKEKEDTEWKKG